ncbi:unnamed protein product [Amoebophrya sp. A120]|nr:unnamed protein product [Amoebophrya sp. A120]|eukprot:GSA120T00024449001.1
MPERNGIKKCCKSAAAKSSKQGRKSCAIKATQEEDCKANTSSSKQGNSKSTNAQAKASVAQEENNDQEELRGPKKRKTEPSSARNDTHFVNRRGRSEQKKTQHQEGLENQKPHSNPNYRWMNSARIEEYVGNK